MFSGGFDLKVMRSGAAAAGKLVTDGGALITRLFGSEVPVVIACSGHAVAAGALLLLGADERIGARGAFRIGLIETETRHGAAAVGGRARAGAALAAATSRIATVGAQMYDPDGAVEAGFLDAVVGAEALPRRRSPRPQRWAALPRGRLPRPGPDEPGRRLGRLADAIAADRGADLRRAAAS